MKQNGRTKTALVAGGAGFLGSHLCEALLARGRRVVCLDNYLTGSRSNVAHLLARHDFKAVEGDVCDPFKADEPIDEIFNLASAASPPLYQADPIHTLMTNVSGTLNLLRLAEAHRASFVQASTSEVYGDPQQHPQHESYWGNVNCTGPRACYDEGKRAAETLCFDMLRLGKVDVRVARIFNTYGPRLQAGDGRIVSNLIVQALKGAPLTIYGSGEQTRSFCYVSDMIAGLVALMDVERNPGAPVNLGNPDEFTINELAELVGAEAGARPGSVFKPLPEDDPQRRCPDIATARAVLGWRPTVALRDGLVETVAWFRQHGHPPVRFDLAEAR